MKKLVLVPTFSASSTVMNTVISQPVQHSQKRMKVFLVMVLDVSSSMEGQRIKRVKDQVRPTVNSLQVGDVIRVIVFSDRATVLCDLYTVQRSNEVFIKELESGLMSRVQGCTALYDAVAKAISEVPKSAEMKRCKPEIVVLTDGEDNSSVHDLESVAQLVRKPGFAHAHFTFVGVSLAPGGCGHRALEQLAESEHCDLLMAEDSDIGIKSTFQTIRRNIDRRIGIVIQNVSYVGAPAVGAQAIYQPKKKIPKNKYIKEL